MNEKLKTAKAWVDDHYEEIALMTYGAFCYGLGIVIGKKITNYSIGKGLDRAHKVGIIRYFDPRTNTEVSEWGAIGVIHDMFDPK